MTFIVFSALYVLFCGWEEGGVCFYDGVGKVWEMQDGCKDCADSEREEGEDYEGEVADEDAELVGEETEVGFCCWMDL